jgi:Phytanoyl-CoA dioxygenase (PhyH)
MRVNQVTIGELKTANHFLGNFEELNALYTEEGYLFLRNVLDLDAIARVKQDFIRVLQAQGIVKAGESEPFWTGAKLEDIDDDALYALDSYQELLDLNSTRQAIEAIFGEPVFMYRNIDIRYALPADDKYLTPAHQDHFFIRQTDCFRTVWIPLMTISRDMGGLALATASHRQGLIEHVEHETVHSYIFRGRRQRGVPIERIPGFWVTADYRPGDLLIFHSLMIHRALPNTSDRIRLSLDTRYQPLSAPKTWQAEKTILQLRQYRREVRDVAYAEGATEQRFESLLIEMMKRGLASNKDNVVQVMAQMDEELCKNA